MSLKTFERNSGGFAGSEPLIPRATPASRVCVRVLEARLNVAPELAARVDELWVRARVAQPGLWDGPLLAFLGVNSGIDGAAPEIVCRRGRYRELVAQQLLRDELGPRALGVLQLSVTGLLVGRDAAGRAHVAIGRRGLGTRIYGGMWELAPSGGVESEGLGSLAQDGILTTALEREACEELGMELDARDAVVAGLIADEEAGSVDVVLRVDLPGRIDPRRGPACWPCGQDPDGEYIDAAWLADADAAAFADEHAQAIIPPTREILKNLGSWLNGATPAQQGGTS